jgi:poly(hydroxyalkanoate) granule-associated protein
MASEQIRTQARKAQNEFTTSARQVFLAGLGAAALAEEQRSRLLDQGGKLFDRLVSRGKKVETEGKRKIEQGRKQVLAARKKTLAGVEKLQGEVDNRFGQLLQRVGIPHQQQIRTLSDRVAELTRKIDSLQKANRAGARA